MLTLKVICVPKKFSAMNNQEVKRTYFIENLDPLVVEYKEFEVKPACNNPFPITYKAQLKDGRPLPPFIKHVAEEKRFFITHEAIVLYKA
jgi:hypothetical protein